MAVRHPLRKVLLRTLCSIHTYCLQRFAHSDCGRRTYHVCRPQLDGRKRRYLAVGARVGEGLKTAHSRPSVHISRLLLTPP
jgi:hypothetical protein